MSSLIFKINISIKIIKQKDKLKVEMLKPGAAYYVPGTKLSAFTSISFIYSSQPLNDMYPFYR